MINLVCCLLQRVWNCVYVYWPFAEFIYNLAFNLCLRTFLSKLGWFFFFLLNFQNCLTPPAAATIFFGANDAAILGRTSERQHVPINEYKVNLLKIVQQMKVYYNPSISFSFASKIYCPLTSRSLNLVLFWSRCSFVLVTSISLMTVYCLLDPMLPKFLCCT